MSEKGLHQHGTITVLLSGQYTECPICVLEEERKAHIAQIDGWRKMAERLKDEQESNARRFLSELGQVQRLAAKYHAALIDLSREYVVRVSESIWQCDYCHCHIREGNRGHANECPFRVLGEGES